jgi:hypothetical protein
MPFAEATSVPVERSSAEIERLLVKYGASRFARGWDDTRAYIAFEMRGRGLRIVLPIPSTDDPMFQGKKRAAPSVIRQRWEQEQRRRWRALALVIKAKLEAVETGIVTFEDEWLAHFVMPGGKTVGEMVAPELERAYATGKPTPLMLGWAGKGE